MGHDRVTSPSPRVTSPSPRQQLQQQPLQYPDVPAYLQQEAAAGIVAEATAAAENQMYVTLISFGVLQSMFNWLTNIYETGSSGAAAYLSPDTSRVQII